MIWWIKHRWFLLSLCFLGLNGFALFHQWNAPARKVMVERASPENLTARLADPLCWNFSEPMVFDDQVGVRMGGELVELLPKVDGEFCWTDTDELTFYPVEAWAPCSAYTVIVSPELKSLDGRRVASGSVFNYSTEPLRVERISQRDYSERSIKLEVVCSEPVSPKQLEEKLEIKTAAGDAVDFYTNESRVRKVVSVIVDRVADQDISVRIAAGLQSPAGALGLAEDCVQSIPLSRELCISSISASSRAFEPGQLSIRFNQSIEHFTADECLEIEPAVEVGLVQCRGNRCIISGAFEAGRHYVVTLKAGVKGSYGATLGQDESRTVYFSDITPAVEFISGGTYMSPQGAMNVPFRSVNSGGCRVVVRRIYSNNLVRLMTRKEERYGYFYGAEYDGLSRVVAEYDLPVDARSNEAVEQQLDLKTVLEGKTGAFHVQISGSRGGDSSQYVIVSDLGITVKQSESDVLVWVNSLRTLASSAGAKVRLFSEENQVLQEGATDENGLVLFDIQQQMEEGSPYLVTVEQGDDLTFLPLSSSKVLQSGSVSSRPYLEDGYEAYLFCDRGIYRPGGTTHLKVIVRTEKAIAPEPFPVVVKVYGPDGNVEQESAVVLNEFGTGELSLAWPDYIPTGKYRAEVVLPGADEPIGQALFSIEEFVPPQLKAEIRMDDGRGDASSEIEFSVHAQHLYGSPAAGQSLKGRIDFFPQVFQPQGWEGYTFGDPSRDFHRVQRVLGKTHLNDDGVGSYTFSASKKWRPSAALKAVVSGTVTEPGGRAVTAYGVKSIDVYPYYVGIKQQKGEPIADRTYIFPCAAVRPDGTADESINMLSLRVEKLTWVSVLKKQDGHFRYVSEEQSVVVEERDVQLSGGRAVIAYSPPADGRYRIGLSDPAHAVSSSIEVYAGGENQSWANRSMESPDIVELEWNKEHYSPGECALLSVRAPFAGKMLLTLENNRILEHRVVELEGNYTEISLPVSEAFSPNIYCSVSVIRAALPEEVWGQHRAIGRSSLHVDRPDHRLQVKLTVPEEIRPQTRLTIPVQVLDQQGAGCRSEVVIAAVDEGICMLTDFVSPDPYAYFFAPRLPAVELYDLYAELVPELTEQISGTASAPGGGMLAALRKRLNPIKAKRFKPLALWSSSVVTDSNGAASVSFDVPEFTGQLRVMAVAVDASRYGALSADVVVKRPLVVQHGLPRFLAPKDSFGMPVRVENDSAMGGTVCLTVDCSGPLDGKQLEREFFLTPGASTNLLFRLDAGAVPGKAMCRIKAVMGEEQYEECVELAVRPPAGLRVVCGSGMISPGEVAEQNIPTAWLQGTGQGEVTVSGLPSVQLAGSLDYLLRYPYGCLEQTTSGAMPLLYLAHLMEQSQPGRLSDDELFAFVESGIHRVLSMQKSNGSFSLWPNSRTYEWGSIYATHFLLEAHLSDYPVPDDALSRALGYLVGIARNCIPMDPDSLYNRSYACYVLALSGNPEHGEHARMFEVKDDLPADARVNLAAALAVSGNRRQALELLDQVGGFKPGHELGECLRSEVRNSALLLSVLVDVDPENIRIVSLVKKLQDAQVNGRWGSTQENAMALMALGKYEKIQSAENTLISGRITLGKGAPCEFVKTNHFSAAVSGEWVQIRNAGTGPLYYFWKSSGVPVDGAVVEHDHRIRVRRVLLNRNGTPADEATLKQGTLYVMQVEVSAGETVDNIAIEDLLPAGVEIENMNFKTSQMVSWLRNQQTLPVLHSDIRDDRMLLFMEQFSGTKTFHYAVRAVTQGNFVWPAISAVCMYDESIQSVNGKGHIAVQSDD